MILLAWTAIVPILICLAIMLLLGLGCLASYFTTGRTKIVIQICLAIAGLAVALLF